jgi:hypothetical protein
VASNVISMLASAPETGQPVLASSEIRLEVLFGDTGDLGVQGQVAAGDAGAGLEAYVSLGVDFFRGESFLASSWLKAMEKQAECAAAMSSSGLVLPPDCFGAGLPGDVERAQA